MPPDISLCCPAGDSLHRHGHAEEGKQLPGTGDPRLSARKIGGDDQPHDYPHSRADSRQDQRRDGHGDQQPGGYDSGAGGVPADPPGTAGAQRRETARPGPRPPHPRPAPGRGRRAGRGQRRLRGAPGTGARASPVLRGAGGVGPRAAAVRGRARLPVRPGPAAADWPTTHRRPVRSRGWSATCRRCRRCWSTTGSTCSAGTPR